MVVIIICVIAGIWFLGAGLPRLIETGKGHSKCAFCRRNLKSNGSKYADVCRACGRTQPWVKAAAK